LTRVSGDRPSWISEIQTRYGSFAQLSNKFSYLNKNAFIQNPTACFRRDSPSLVRMDVTYGSGSSASWLFSVLQGMFVFLGVTEDRFSKEQVYNLACNIAANYKTLKVVEILLFISRFEAGRYGRFYGGDSYALVVTEAMAKFMVEREHYYADIERERAEKRIGESKKGTISFEEYRKMKEDRGETTNLGFLFGEKD
jgi:hypothetical protein